MYTHARTRDNKYPQSVIRANLTPVRNKNALKGQRAYSPRQSDTLGQVVWEQLTPCKVGCSKSPSSMRLLFNPQNGNTPTSTIKIRR